MRFVPELPQRLSDRLQALSVDIARFGIAPEDPLDVWWDDLTGTTFVTNGYHFLRLTPESITHFIDDHPPILATYLSSSPLLHEELRGGVFHPDDHTIQLLNWFKEFVDHDRLDSGFSADNGSDNSSWRLVQHSRSEEHDGSSLNAQNSAPRSVYGIRRRPGRHFKSRRAPGTAADIRSNPPGVPPQTGLYPPSTSSQHSIPLSDHDYGSSSSNGSQGSAARIGHVGLLSYVPTPAEGRPISTAGNALEGGQDATARGGSDVSLSGLFDYNFAEL